jgi:hypothetical protein
MDIQDFKRWHWIVISVVVGLVLAYTRTSMEPPRGPRSTKPPQFEAELIRPPLKSGESFVKNLTIYPPINGVYPVQFDLLVPTKDNKAWTYTPWYMDAETPYPAVVYSTGIREINGHPYTILDHLEHMQKTHPENNIKFAFAWWATTQWVYILWTAGSVVLIGGIWPTILNLLLGAGFGPEKKDEDAYDLERFGKGKTQGHEPVSTKREVTADDHAQMAELQSKLEQNLGGFGMQTDGERAVGTAVAATTVKKLDSKPLEAVEIKKEEDDKDYKGEFYPVARPQGHVDEQKPGR